MLGRDQESGCGGHFVTMETNEANIYGECRLDSFRRLIARVCTVTNNPVWAGKRSEIVGIYQTVIDHTKDVLAERKLRESERPGRTSCSL